jgi:8-oxo-dGTP pyrophosphatase MutT (NUDIX family)
VSAPPRRPVDTWPAWTHDLVEGTAGAQAVQLSRFAPPPGHLRRSAVLILFGERANPSGPVAVSGTAASSGVSGTAARAAVSGTAASSGGGLSTRVVPDIDVLLTERASTLRSHAGQVAFPGGRIDPGDAGPAAAALREAQEETGLEPSGVEVVAQLAEVYLPPSDYAVTPVLGWWHTPSPVGVMDPAEVARVVRVPVPALVDPANRFRAVHPSGFVGPAFGVSGLFVWGFTAGLLDRVLHLTGWERPWDHDRLQSVPMVPDPPRDRSARA